MRIPALFPLLMAACIPALAQSQVSVTGGLDTYLGSLKASGDAARRNVVGSGGMTTSFFGFRGEEDLGGGLRAEFRVAGMFQMDTGMSGRFAGDNLFSRDANVALSGRYGRLQLGRAASPAFLAMIPFNPFGNSLVFSPLLQHSFIPTGPLGARNWAAGIAGDSGWSNHIAYTSPTWKGLRTSLHFQPGEREGKAGANNAAVTALYQNGPLALTMVAQHVRESNPNQGNPIMEPSRAPINFAAVTAQRAAIAGASYDFGKAKLTGTFQRTREETAGPLGMRGRTASLGLSIPAGLGAVLLAAAESHRSGSLLNGRLARRTVSAGYDHRMSKRTDLYAIAMSDSLSGQARGNSLGMGIRHFY
ncbi:porin [Massilia endophytica]|uniref:porin n=1 Tax=Massilia endophytica TaxID=2899220 RepID=UPI001E46B2A7|nr:porin [Massilia endophytica]UGQ46578.1 porin [Massilia endophytica]